MQLDDIFMNMLYTISSERTEQVAPSYITYKHILSIDDRMPNPIREQMEGQLHRLEKRLAHTLKRIRDKNLYYNSFEHMMRQAPPESKQGRLAYLIRYHSMRNHSFASVKFETEDWYIAIEMAMYSRLPRIFLDPEMPPYAPHIEECIFDVWANLIFISMLNFKNEVFDVIDENNEDLNKLSDVTLMASKAQEDLIAEKKAHALTIQKYKDCVSKSEYDALLKDRNLLAREAQKKHKEERHKISKEQRQAQLALDKKNQIIANLESELDTFRNMLSDDDSDDETTECDETITLPEKNIVVVGGHERFVTLLKQRYPNWAYINRSESAICENPKLVLICANQVTHKMCEKVFSSMRSAEFRFTKSGNIDLFITDAKTHYANILKRKETVEC